MCISDRPHTDRTFAENKRTLRNLAVACVAYLSCINLALEQQAEPAKVQKRRQREGKPPILPYYTVVVAPAYRGQEDADGLAVSYTHLDVYKRQV